MVRVLFVQVSCVCSIFVRCKCCVFVCVVLVSLWCGVLLCVSVLWGNCVCFV